MSQPNYLLPTQQNAFQREIYIHLIEWKWHAGMMTAGSYRGKKHDAILTPEDAKKRLLIYDKVHDRLDQHHAKFPFRFHEHFNHMASSQAACVNLFLPLLVSGDVGEEVLRQAKPDLARIDRDQLDEGFCIEYWGARAGEKPGRGQKVGLLKDKTVGAGTDCDIAIAYRDNDNKRCLWMIEHKLTEPEFTTCGGCLSKARNAARTVDPTMYNCDKSFSEIIADKDICYYHSKCGYAYWDLMDRFQSFFPNHAAFDECPFQGGMNQLWRNQLLALAIEHGNDHPFEKVTFSVVKHPRNRALDRTLVDYQRLIGDTDRFFHFDSSVLVNAASGLGNVGLTRWVEWYRGLYNLHSKDEQGAN
jgi:Restriction Endonuclease associating with ARP